MQDHRILFTDPVAFRDILLFAEKVGASDQLGRDLQRLFITLTGFMSRGADADGKEQPVATGDITARIGRDFAPYSLVWAVMRGHGREAHCLYAGGFIYDGPGAPGDGSTPSFSVNLGRLSPGGRPLHSWNIHT